MAISSATRSPQHLNTAVEERNPNATPLREDEATAVLGLQSRVSSTMPDSSRVKTHSNSTPSDGDTQQASQWVYDAKERVPTKSGAPYMQEEGDTGHINILDGFEQEVGHGEDTELLVEELDEDDVHLVSQEIRAEPFPESMRFQLPKTPLTQGTKRKRSSQGETSQIETPRLPANPFAGLKAAGTMRPSQIFQATQAQTSPHILQSDGMYERPSPNVNNLGRPSTAGSLSSPVMIRDQRSSMVGVVIEPQGTYISMKESQEARERRLQKMRMEQDDLSDDEFGLPSRTQPQRSFGRDRNVRDARSQMARKPPPRKTLDNPNTKFKRLLEDRQAMRRSEGRASEAVLVSDDALAGESQGNITEDETEREEEKEDKDYDDEIDELAEDNKENVEVPMTVSRPNYAQVIRSQTSPSCHHIRRRTRTPGAKSATQVKGSPSTPRSPSREAGSENGTQPYAVRDSQSSQHRSSKERPAGSAPSVPHSSPESRHMVLQSQLSQKSKSPFLPSNISRKVVTDEVVIQLPSSSPPLLDGLQSNALDIVRPDIPLNLEERDNKRNGTSMSRVPHSDIQSHTEQAPLPKGSQNTVGGSSNLPATADNTIPQTSSTVMRNAASRKIIPNSSQDLSSSGPMPQSASKAATNQSSNAQSRGTTLYETAQEQLSVSPSKNHAQRLQVRSQGSNVPSPTKNLQRRTLGEIAADPSPPDPLGDVNLSDFGLLSKEDEDFQNVVQRPSLTEPATRKRLVKTSTQWKGLSTDPPSDYLGTPVGPAFSQVLAPAEVHIDEPQSSSPLSTPPASQHMGLLPPAISKDVLGTLSAPHVAPSSDTPVPMPVRKLSAPDSPRISPAPQTDNRTRSRSPAAKKQSLSVDWTGNNCNAAPPLSTDLPVVAPDRVFAHFNGKQSAFYTATCLGVILGEEPRYSIRYDDGAEDSISAFGIKRLEFRPGDVVKVDLPSYRTKSYVVIGMQDKQDLEDPDTLARRRKANPDDKEAWPEVDVHGYAKVLLSPRRRDSVNGDHTNSGQIAVGLYHLYFTQAMWTNIKDRDYTHVDRRSRTLLGSQKPSERHSTSSSPSSRAKRGKTTSLAKSITMEDPNPGLFSNMVFTLTNIYQLTDLERTKSFILNNGGKVLEEGFDSLFHVPILHRITSPKKSDSDRDFHPTRQAQNLGFTCLIADKYCRRAKYIQALALGIPCLATRWIGDCVSKQRILPWSAYLLPAGESTFLGGAARSRVLPSLPAETAPLSKIVEQRPRMLEGASILLIMSKTEEETMRQHPLLTFALGPTRVARALTIEAAARAVAEAQAVGEPWDWVFSYDREREVERVLFRSAAKKRKSRAGDGLGQEGKTRVIGNEFVIQSLILGQLVDM